MRLILDLDFNSTYLRLCEVSCQTDDFPLCRIYKKWAVGFQSWTAGDADTKKQWSTVRWPEGRRKWHFKFLNATVYSGGEELGSMGLNRAGSSNINRYLSWQHLRPSEWIHSDGTFNCSTKILHLLFQGRTYNFQKKKKVLNAYCKYEKYCI